MLKLFTNEVTTLELGNPKLVLVGFRTAVSDSKLELESAGVGRSRPFGLESESERESEKFRRLRLRPGVAGYQPSTDSHFGRTVMLGPENIERQQEKKRGGVEIELKRHLVI